MTARVINRPEPGFFKQRLVRGGPWVGSIIWRQCPFILEDGQWFEPTERSQPLAAMIDGIYKHVDQVWLSAHFCSEAEYRYLIDLAEWRRLGGKDEEPAKPEPKMRVDVSKLASIF